MTDDKGGYEGFKGGIRFGGHDGSKIGSGTASSTVILSQTDRKHAVDLKNEDLVSECEWIDLQQTLKTHQLERQRLQRAVNQLKQREQHLEQELMRMVLLQDSGSSCAGGCFSSKTDNSANSVDNQREGVKAELNQLRQFHLPQALQQYAQYCGFLQQRFPNRAGEQTANWNVMAQLEDQGQLDTALEAIQILLHFKERKIEKELKSREAQTRWDIMATECLMVAFLDFYLVEIQKELEAEMRRRKGGKASATDDDDDDLETMTRLAVKNLKKTVANKLMEKTHTEFDMRDFQYVPDQEDGEDPHEEEPEEADHDGEEEDADGEEESGKEGDSDEEHQSKRRKIEEDEDDAQDQDEEGMD